MQQKSLYLLFAFLVCGLSLFGQQKKDKALVKATIEMYFDGWMTGDTTKVGKAMHSTCHLKFIRNGKMGIRNRTEYLSGFKPRSKSVGTEGRIKKINITGNIAAAKCEIETPKRLFTDYFNMMKIDEQWYIVDKISTSVTK